MLIQTEPRRAHDRPIRPRAAIVLAVGLLVVTAFQAALALGAPFGAAALGGTNPGQLPDALRVVTGLAAVVWLFGSLLVLARGGYAVLPLPRRVTGLGTWVLVGVLGVGAVLNVASSSPWERFGRGPFTLVLLVLGVVLARSGWPSHPGGVPGKTVASAGVEGASLTTEQTAGIARTIPRGVRRRLALLAVVAGLALGGLGGLLFGPHSLHLGPRVSGDHQLADDFRHTLESDRGLASVEVARLRDGKVTFAGLAPDGTEAPTPQTPFELGSVTKTMTGLLLADAVERGEMRRHAPVSDYLPELAGTAAGAATLDQLATHHSGLPAVPSGAPLSSVRAAWGNANPFQISTETLLQLTRDTPRGTPGRFAYSNLGMALLGHAEARAAGAVDWPALARQRLLVPLGMTNTTFVTSADQIPEGLPYPRKENGWRAPHWYGEAFAPAGTSTVTTAEDVMKYARAVVKGTAPGLAALEPVADADAGQIGLAWRTFDVSGRTLSWHNGGTGGHRSMLALDRETGQAVLVLNSSTRWVDDPGLQLAAAASPADLGAALQPGLGLGSLAAVPVGLVLLASGAATLLRSRHRIAAVRGALSAAAGLVMLRVHGPWALLPAELWTALAGLVLACVVVSLPRFKTHPIGPKHRRGASVTALGSAVLALAALVWTA